MITSNTPIVMMGSGRIIASDVDVWPSHWPHVGVDGGGNTLMKLGRPPHLITGDLDSFVPDPTITCPIIETPDQNRTDFDKALDHLDAPVIIGLGFLSDRMDHGLSALDTIARSSKAIMLIGDNDCVCKLTTNWSMDTQCGARISIVPWPTCTFKKSSGLRYPLTDLTLHMGERLGTSNEADATNICIETDAGDQAALIMMEKTHQKNMLQSICPSHHIDAFQL